VRAAACGLTASFFVTGCATTSHQKDNRIVATYSTDDRAVLESPEADSANLPPRLYVAPVEDEYANSGPDFDKSTFLGRLNRSYNSAFQHPHIIPVASDHKWTMMSAGGFEKKYPGDAPRIHIPTVVYIKPDYPPALKINGQQLTPGQN